MNEIKHHKVDKVLAKVRFLGDFRTDKELSKKLHINYGTIDNWKRRGYIPVKRLMDFAKFLGVSVDYLLDERQRASYTISATINNSKNSNNNIAIAGTERPASSQSHDEELLARFCELYKNYHTPKVERRLLDLIQTLEEIERAGF